MLSETIKALRVAKGLSQEELAGRLHVVRQTISKWEQGLSVPDAELLVALSDALEVPASTLLGEAPPETDSDLAGQLARIDRQLARNRLWGRRALQGLLIAVCAAAIAGFAVCVALESPYLGWDYSDPETAVLGVAFHALEWLFIRCAPVLLLAAIAGLVRMRRKG